MKHFGISQWVDFARGVATAAERSALTEHLSEGCAECRQAADFWQALNGIGSAIRLEAAPEEALRQARSICPPRPRGGWRRTIRIPVELIYDSSLAPVPAGLRSSWQVGWQALYRAGHCSVDVRIEPDLRSSRATLIGQVSNHVQPERRMENIPVCLRAGKRTVAETLSNRFGEFHLEYDQQSKLELCVQLDGGLGRIVTPLRRIACDGIGVQVAAEKTRNRGNKVSGGPR